MKVIQINIFGNLSTGRISVDIYRTLKVNGHEGKVAFARNTIAADVPHIKIGNKWSVYADGVMTRLTDKAGFYSKSATKNLIIEIKAYNPDIIHLHNLHGYYINIEILFEYLRICGKPIVWTLHDCWAYTGHCCYYSMAECARWKTGCYDCPQKNAYPRSKLLDNSEWNYQKKKELFTSIPNLHIVAVSKWLIGEVKQSFLKDLPCTVIYNGIDTEKFKPTKSDFRTNYGLTDKFIILGVASTWDERKGLNDFIKLANMLGENYSVVVIGVNEQEKRRLATNMIGIDRTDSIEELAGIYSTADVFFNASVEETFGLPTVEALACGTPVVVYNATALPEVVDKDCGFIVKKHDLEDVRKKISIICETKTLNQQQIIQLPSRFDKEDKYLKYIKVYGEIMR